MTAARAVSDYLRRGLDLVIVGINPGTRSGETGHHYAWPGNHFWPLLHESGLVPQPLTYAEDRRVLDFGVGLTNLVDRPSRQASDLSQAEMRGGAAALREKLLRYRPRIVCFNGKSIYEAFAGRRDVRFGLQPERLDGMLLFVTPSSSARTAAYQKPQKLAFYQELKALVDAVREGRES
jgi:mismatch-specific thymine-DNA glycosylase